MTDIWERVPSRGRARPSGNDRGRPPEPPRGRPPRIDPRIARRWIEVRREEGRRRLRVVVGVLAVAVVLAVAAGSLYTPIFALRHIRVSITGPSPASTAGVVGVAGLSGHPQMINVDPAAAERRLDADPWLGAARVSRHWPSTVTITATARRPLADAVVGPPTDRQWAEIDATGRVLADVTAPPAGLPQLDAVGPLPAPGGWLPGTAGPGVPPGARVASLVDLDAAPDAGDIPGPAAAALAVLADLPQAIRADVVALGIRPTLSLVVSVPGGGGAEVTFLLGNGSQLQAKTAALVTMIDGADLSGVTEVDLTVPARPATTGAPAGRH